MASYEDGVEVDVSTTLLFVNPIASKAVCLAVYLSTSLHAFDSYQSVHLPVTSVSTQVALCEDVFEGLWSYWLGLCCIAACLFLCLICLSLLWQYFNPLYWNLEMVRQKTEVRFLVLSSSRSSYHFLNVCVTS